MTALSQILKDTSIYSDELQFVLMVPHAKATSSHLGVITLVCAVMVVSAGALFVVTVVYTSSYCHFHDQCCADRVFLLGLPFCSMEGTRIMMYTNLSLLIDS